MFHVKFTGRPQNLAIEGKVDLTKPIRQYQLTPDGDNLNRCFEGDASLSKENWGTFLPPGEGGFPPPPYISPEDGDLYLSDVWVLGQPGDSLHVKILFYEKGNE